MIVKTLHLISIAAVLCFSVQTSGFAPCSQINCSPSSCCQDSVTGPACYSSSQYTCTVSSDGLTTRLCPPSHGVCAGACYQLSGYQCVNGALQQGSAQPTVVSPTQAATPTASATTTIKPTTTTKPATTTTTPTTTKPATAAPTSPAASTTTAPTTAPTSCSSICGTMSCCDDTITGSIACYNPSQYSCPIYNGGLSQRLCPLGNGVCAGVCYDKTQYVCNANGTISQGHASTTANKPGVPGLPGVPTTTPTTPLTTTAPTAPSTTNAATTPAATTTVATNPATTPAATTTAPTTPITTTAGTNPATTPAATTITATTNPATTPAATTTAPTTPITTAATTTPANTPAATTTAPTTPVTVAPITVTTGPVTSNPSGLVTPLQPFCVGACQSPVSQGFPSGTNAIPRSTPDGVGQWPVEESCNAGWAYGVPPRATWWDNFSSQQALPTNMWFVPYYSNPPNAVNAQGLTWPVYAMPFSTQATGSGFKVGVPTPSLIQSQPGLFDGSPPPVLGFGVTTQQFTFRTTDGFLPGKKITDFDRDGLGITLQYTTNGAQTMTIPVIRGHPFITAIFTSTTPAFDYTVGDIGFINGVNTNNQMSTVVSPVAAAGMYVFDITIVSGTTPSYGFRLYTSQNIPITVSKPTTSGCLLLPWTIVFNSACVGTCILRLAAYSSSYQDPVNPASFYTSTLSIPVSVLDASANVYPIVDSANPNRTVQFYDGGNTALNQYMYWNTACVNPGISSCNPANLLMLALPHHLDLLPASQVMSTVTFPTQNGIAYGILGNSWTLSFNVPNIVGQTLLNDPFQFQNPITDPITIAQISGTLATDMATLIGPINYATFDGADCYSFGKYIAAVARLTLIADSLGNSTIAAEGRTFMRERLDSWFNVNSSPFPFRTQDELTYDTTWGGLIPSDAIGMPGGLWSQDSTQPEFGSGGYNDHMFHYGYFLYAVAVVIKSGSAVDTAWFQNDFTHIIGLARDIANPDSVNDPWFTGFRHKNDWYVGHSWACGLFPSGDYPNVESTSEALNAWYAMYLLGTAMGNIGYGSFAANMKFVGKILSVTDTQSFHYYSRMYPTPSGNNALVYPTEFTALGIIGNLWGGQAIFQTYFGFGDCEDMSAPLLPSYPPSCVQRHILTGDQVRYYNSLMVFLIQAMPFTPYTNSLQNVTWLSQGLFAPAASFANPDGSISVGYSPEGKSQFIPDFFNRCADNDGCDSWLAYGWQSAAAVNGAARTAALNELSLYGSVPAGTTMTNILFHIASQSST